MSYAAHATLLESKSSWIIEDVSPGVNGENLTRWVEDATDVFLENTVASLTASLFLQPDEIANSPVVEEPFELPELSQTTIAHALS